MSRFLYLIAQYFKSMRLEKSPQKGPDRQRAALLLGRESEPSELEINLPFAELELANDCRNSITILKRMIGKMRAGENFYNTESNLRDLGSLALARPRNMDLAANGIEVTDLQQLIQFVLERSGLYHEDGGPIDKFSASKIYGWLAGLIVAFPELETPSYFQAALDPDFTAQFQRFTNSSLLAMSAISLHHDIAILRHEQPSVEPEVLEAARAECVKLIADMIKDPNDTSVTTALFAITDFNTIALTFGMEPCELPVNINTILWEAYKKIDDYRPMDYDPSPEDVRRGLRISTAMNARIINEKIFFAEGRLTSKLQSQPDHSLPHRLSI